MEKLVLVPYDKYQRLLDAQPVKMPSPATPSTGPRQSDRTKSYLTTHKPEDHWSCKRSPDILTLVKHKTYKTWKIYGKEMTLTFNTHIHS